MQTDKIRVTSRGAGVEEALDETEKFAEYVGLEQEQAGWIRLLSEETLGMVKAIIRDFSAEFWLESTKKKGCRIHLRAEADMDYAKKQELISVSTRQENEAASGFMGLLSRLVEGGYEKLMGKDPSRSDISLGVVGISEFTAMHAGSYLWSLAQYREDLEKHKEENSDAEDAWEDLEKSLVAKIADDIRVAVDGDQIELIIEKNF